MRRFHELTIHEQAAFNTFEEVVEKFLPIELMHEGIVPPEEPVYEELVPELPEGANASVVYQLTAATRNRNYALQLYVEYEDAKDVLDRLNATGIKFLGNEYSFHTTRPEPVSIGIMPTKFYSDDVQAFRDAAQSKNEAIKEANEAKRTAYNEASEAVGLARSALYILWYESIAKVQRLARIVDTFNEYVAIAEGNHAVAMGFLLKTKGYTHADIAEALNEQGISIDKSLLKLTEEEPQAQEAD